MFADPKIGALKNSAIFTEKKYVLESLFHKGVGLKACNFIKRRLQHRYFPVNIAKFLRTAVFIKHFRHWPKDWLRICCFFEAYTPTLSHYLFVLSKSRVMLTSQTVKSRKVLFFHIKKQKD